MARLSSELVLSLTDRVSGPARGVERSLHRLEGQTRRTSRMTAADAGRMGTAQKMALAGVSGIAAPLAAGLGAREVITQSADFESALTNIQKKAGTSAAQTAKLGEEIKALATSGDLAVPIEEIAAAYERGAAAGIPLGELKQFATLSAKAADAFEMSATDVGNAAAGFKVGLGIPINEMARYFDLINGLADTGIADESGVVNFLDRAGASLKLFGLSAQQAAAYATTMLNLKMAPDIGANALSTLTGKLLSPGSESAEIALRNIVGNVDDFQKILKKDANKALLVFLERINKLDKFRATELLNGFVGAGFDDEILRMAAGIDEVQRNLKFAGGSDWFGSLDKSYKLKLDDMWSQWQLLKNQMSTLAIDLGSMGMPAFKAGLQSAIDLVKGIQDGMAKMEMEIDWTAVDAAKTAGGDLGAELRGLLGMDTSDSMLKEFFTDLSGVINEVSGVVTSVTTELSRLAKFAKDPIGYMDWATSDEGMRAHGVTPMNSESRAQARRDGDAANGIANAQADADRDRSLGDFVDGDGVQRNRSTQAERGGRFARPVPAFAPAMPAPIKAPTFGAAPLPTARPDYAPPIVIPPQQVAPAPVSVPIPTPRPDIVGPITAEGEAAALKAQEIGSRISNAFAVSATATVNMNDSAIDASQRKLDRYLASLAQVGPASRSAAADANAAVQSAGRAGFDGIHADIED